MKSIVELQRRASPVSRPQALFVDETTIWVSSRDTKRLYALDRSSWEITWETAAPGNETPWGVTKVGGTLFVVCGSDIDDVDDRRIRRVLPGTGFDPDFDWPCPNGMGSHLSHDGTGLVLSQWYEKKLIALDGAGKSRRVLQASHGIVGHCFASGAFFLATCDDEASDNYWLTRMDPASGRSEDLARIGFAARALAFDGVNFWTNHREQHEIVCFAPPS